MGKINRIEHSIERLTMLLEIMESVPYLFGKNDCFTFVADCVEEQTGVDPLAEHRYTTPKKAKELIKKYGSTEEAMNHVFGPSREAAYGKIGDPVMMRQKHFGFNIVGVVYTNGTHAITRTPDPDQKFNLTPLNECLRSWSLD